MIFLIPFSLYWISNNFPTRVHGEMCGCLLCCLDSWIFKSPYMQFLSVLPSQHHVCLPQRILSGEPAIEADDLSAVLGASQ